VSKTSTGPIFATQKRFPRNPRTPKLMLSFATRSA